MASDEEDFNIISEEREDILANMQEMARTTINPQLWAVFQVCDIDVLKNLHKQMAETLSPDWQLKVWETSASSMLLTWRQKDASPTQPQPTPLHTPSPKQPRRVRSVSATNSPAYKRLMTQAPDASPQQSSPLATTQTPATAAQTPPEAYTPQSPRSVANDTPRSATVKANANIRDGYRCIITGQGEVESAHILPYSILKDNEQQPGKRAEFWWALGLFWDKDWLEKALGVVSNQDNVHNLALSGYETIRNTVSLTNSAHALWNKGHFALKPELPSADGTSMSLRIFWQRMQQGSSDGTFNITTKAKSTKDLWRSDHGAFLAKAIGNNRENIESLASGDIIQITTPDPIEYPLPSYELLRLQWYLTRIVGMAGAAEVDTWIDPRDPPDVDAIWGIDEGVDESVDELSDFFQTQ